MMSAEQFSQLVLRRLNERIKGTLHPSLYESMMQEIGNSLSRELFRNTPEESYSSDFSKEETVSRYASWLQSTFSWIDTVAVEPQHSHINAFIRHCPFGDAATPQLCRLEASLFGCAAGDRFGFAKVGTFGSSQSGCQYTIGLERTHEILAYGRSMFSIDSREVSTRRH